MAAPRLQTPRFRLFLDAIQVDGDAAGYSFFMDSSAGSKLRTSAGGYSETVDGPVQLVTGEAFGNQFATITIPVGVAGSFLKDAVSPQDSLRVELMDDSGDWRVAFDGFVSSIRWQKSAGPAAFSWVASLSAQGILKLFSGDWINWQGALNVLKDKAVLGPGSEVFQELNSISQTAPITDIVRLFTKRTVSDFLQFSVRGKAVSLEPGGTAQLAADESRDWQNAFHLWTSQARDFWLNAEGSLWGLLQRMIEPDVHELFWTYAPPVIGFGDEIPTLVFRPKPWPGPGVQPGNSSIVDDPGLWPQLDLFKLGVDGEPGCLQVSSARDDGYHPNAFSFAESDANMDSNASFMQKQRYGLWFDKKRIQRYGLSFRRLSLSVLNRQADYLDDMQRLTARVAWQEVGLPDMRMEQRSYPLRPGIRIGSVLEDHTDDLATGYIVSVQHQIRGTVNRLSGFTTISTERVLYGVDRDEYVAAARALGAGLVHQDFIGEDDTTAAINAAKDATYSQPPPSPEAAAATSGLCPTSTHLPNVPDAAQTANLLLLKQLVLDPLASSFSGYHLTSGFRSEAVNSALSVGGSSTSLHKQGLAADLTPPMGKTMAQLKAAVLALNCPNLHECFVEAGTHVHVSIKQSPQGSADTRDRDGNSA